MSFTALTFEQLISALARSKGQESVVTELATSHSEKGEQLAEALVNKNQKTFLGLVKVYEHIPESVYPFLKDMVLSNDVNRSNAAVNALAEMKGGAGVDAALEIIENPDPAISGRAATILRKMGFTAVPFLRDKLKTENPSKRGLAILIELDPDSSDFFESALKDMLGTKDQILSRYAIDAASSIGDLALPILIDLIGSSDPYEQQNATNALIKIGEPIVIELVEELDHPNNLIQQNAIRALKEIGLPAAPYLKEALYSDSQLIKQNATAVLNSPEFKIKRGLLSRFKNR